MIKVVDIERLKNKYFHCVGTQFDNAILVAEKQFLIDAYTKADMVSMLEEIQKEIEMMSDTVVESRTVTITSWKGMQKRICDLVQSRIDKLKEIEADA